MTDTEIGLASFAAFAFLVIVLEALDIGIQDFWDL